MSHGGVCQSGAGKCLFIYEMTRRGDRAGELDMGAQGAKRQALYASRAFDETLRNRASRLSCETRRINASRARNETRLSFASRSPSETRHSDASRSAYETRERNASLAPFVTRGRLGWAVEILKAGR
jgi:hypothetical protein